MTKSLARSLAPEIRVNAVCPGFIGTRWFSERFGPETYARIVEHNMQSTPLHRAGTPEDVADAVLFFCAEGARPHHRRNPAQRRRPPLWRWRG